MSCPSKAPHARSPTERFFRAFEQYLAEASSAKNVRDAAAEGSSIRGTEVNLTLDQLETMLTEFGARYLADHSRSMWSV